MERLVVKGRNIYTGREIIQSGFILMESGFINRVGTDTEFSHMDVDDTDVLELDNSFSIIPGMIDMHIHGASGADVMDATPEALRTIAEALPSEGITSFLATTLTESEELIKKALQNAADYIRPRNHEGSAEILGIHLEGPFIAPERPGAQSKEHILNPTLEKLAEFQRVSGGSIRQVTMAPERPGAIELIKSLSAEGVIVSIGHSNAKHEEVMQAVAAGAKQVTHLYNAMSPIHHRDPGVVGGALMEKGLLCELIVDGIHVHPLMVQMAYKLKGKEGLVLVTDAIRAKCLGDGSYMLGNQSIQVHHDRAVLQDGTLAGSILTMKESIQNTRMFTGCSLDDIVHMTAVNPAKQLNLFQRKGSLETGKDAALVVLDRNMDIMMTFCKGKLVFRKNEVGGDAGDFIG